MWGESSENETKECDGTSAFLRIFIDKPGAHYIPPLINRTATQYPDPASIQIGKGEALFPDTVTCNMAEVWYN
jgi:hypothetical protein